MPTRLHPELCSGPLNLPTADVDQASATLEEFLEQWLWGKQSLRPSTHAAYEIHVRRYLVPALGDLRLEALRATDIERAYRSFLEAKQGSRPLAVASVRRIHSTLMSALNTATRRGLLERNPAATIELPRAARPTTSAWTPQEFGQFLEKTNGHRFGLLYLILGVLGLRRGEAVALRWTDLDLARGTLRVERSAVRVGTKTVIGPPKSATSIRTLALDSRTVSRLAQHAADQRAELSHALGVDHEPELVFTSSTGQMLDPPYVSRLFERLQREAGSRRIRLHDLRHTSASIGLASGESLVEVSRRLGHSSISITADIYSHVTPEVAKASVERLASAIYGSDPI